ncbi:hypothetical protein [Haloferula sp.]|uniref:hypothetical protein n=1 Tax=Haloferula sp. TaxID=2497595 RepID=UPI003C77C773
MPNSSPKPQKRQPKRAKGVLALTFLAIFAFVFYSFIRKQQGAANCQQAINNMRSLSLAFLEFDQEYGSFPNDETAGTVIESTGTKLLALTGPYSNPYFRQLIAFGIQSEQIFYATHPEGIHKPDSIMTADQALAPGEVGMSYVYGLNSSSDPRLPLLLAPMKSGTYLAWRGPYHKKAAVLLLHRGNDPFHNPPFDINRRGQILLADGSLLLDPAQAFWQGRPIDIRHPKLPD